MVHLMVCSIVYTAAQMLPSFFLMALNMVYLALSEPYPQTSPNNITWDVPSDTPWEACRGK